MPIDLVRLEQAMSKLSTTQRILLHRVFIDGDCVYEAAKQMGIRSQEAQKIVESTIKALRIKLK